MAIPSGSGTEVLKVDKKNPTNVAAQVLINGVADHIYTVLSVITCETTGNPEIFSMYLKHQGGTSYYILANQALAGRETFIWNTKFSLIGGDKLIVHCDAAADLDVIYSYLDQDFS